MRLRHELGLAVLIGLLPGCSLFSSETPRFNMSSMEGRMLFEEKSALAREAVFDAVDAWVADRLNSRQVRIETRDKALGLFRLRGHAPVAYFGLERQCAYILTLRAADNSCRLEFETREIDNGYAPNPSHLQQMESQYQTLRASLQAALNPTKK